MYFLFYFKKLIREKLIIVTHSIQLLQMKA